VGGHGDGSAVALFDAEQLKREKMRGALIKSKGLTIDNCEENYWYNSSLFLNS